MSKSATILGLVAVAAATYPAGYESSAEPVWSSSAAPVYSSSASSWAGAVSSSVPYYSSGWSSSAAAVYPSSSWVSSYVASSSVPYYPGSSSSYAAPSASASPVYPACWSKCFEEAGITSESDLCGNVEVDKCIHDGCCQEEAWAYWQWYDSYCPAPSSSVPVPYSTVPVGPYSSSVPAPTPSAPVDNCWTECFAENDVTSEAELCGNDAVSKCIHDTCCASLDKAYWDWYNGYCVAAYTTVYTTTVIVTPTAPATVYTTTYEVTSGYSWSPVQSSPATGYPVPPPAPAPYSSYPAPGSSAAPVYGSAAPTGYAAPSASQWAPVPATGAGAATKPGLLLGAVLAVAALF